MYQPARRVVGVMERAEDRDRVAEEDVCPMLGNLSEKNKGEEWPVRSTIRVHDE